MAIQNKQKTPFTLASPMTKRLSHVTDEGEETRLSDYKGVFFKSLFFLGAAFLGVALCFLLFYAFPPAAEEALPVGGAVLTGGIIAFLGMIVFPSWHPSFPALRP